MNMCSAFAGLDMPAVAEIKSVTLTLVLFLYGQNSRVSYLYFCNLPDIYFHDIHIFPAFIKSATYPINLLSAHPSWKILGTKRKLLWGWGDVFF